jgi:hypothetical protein
VATDAAPSELTPMARGHEPGQAATPAKGFAGLSRGQILVGLLLLSALIWAMWTTRELLHLRQHKVVSVRLGELVNQFALAEARSGDDPDKVTARTRAYMAALDSTLKERSEGGAVVLVGEAIVSSSGEDITAAVAADVAKLVPMPVAQALPPRMPVAPVSGPTASPAGGVGQAFLGATGLATSSGAGPTSIGGEQGAGYEPSPYQQGAPDSSAIQGGGDVQP